MELQGLRDLSEGQRYKVSRMWALLWVCVGWLKGTGMAVWDQHRQLPSLCSWTSVSRRISLSTNPSASRAALGPCACTW